MTMKKKPVIAITMGDPVGVGPEIILKALNDKRVRKVANPVVVGDARVLAHIAGKLKIKAPKKGFMVKTISCLDPLTLSPGNPVKKTGLAMIAYIEDAVGMAVKGEVDAIVTAPISKDAAKKAGFPFPGHTEFIAHLTRTKDFCMMLGGKDLKVILVTIHEALKDVPGLVTKDAVLKTLKITDATFKRYFGIKRPRIAVAGLNPHAGEGGIFGDEEAKVITPAIKRANRLGINAIGPLPPDTVFFRTVRKKEFDCVVAMYHDQGLGPLKLLHFEDGVNATFGLPIIRTSVDHGTAYDIAWKGIASPESLIAAIVMAADMANKRKKK